jgi:hypothetical protein
MALENKLLQRKLREEDSSLFGDAGSSEDGRDAHA